MRAPEAGRTPAGTALLRCLLCLSAGLLLVCPVSARAQNETTRAGNIAQDEAAQDAEDDAASSRDGEASGAGAAGSRAPSAARPEAPPLTDEAEIAEEIVVTGIRRDGRKWRPPPLPEEEENDWRRRDAAGNVDVGRIEVGRASVYQDLLERRQYDAFRDDYRDPRPQTSIRFRFGKPRE